MAWKELYSHKPDSEQIERMIHIRSQYIELADYLLNVLPEGRPKSLAKTHLEDSLMRAIQAVALLGEKQEKGT